jgi:hypothetical protein
LLCGRSSRLRFGRCLGFGGDWSCLGAVGRVGLFGRLCRRLLGGGLLLGGLLLGRLLFFLGFFRRSFPDQPFTLRLTADAVGLGLDDARRVTLRSDAERVAQIKGLLVGEPKLATELIHTYFLWHLVFSASLGEQFLDVAQNAATARRDRIGSACGETEIAKRSR